MDFCKLTEALWKACLSDKETDNKKIFDWIEPNSCVIGTELHKFHMGAKDFLSTWIEKIKEQQNTELQIKSFQCEQRELSPDIYLAYGSICIFGENKDHTPPMDLHSRFSIVYQKINGKWKIVHFHQCVPNMEQLSRVHNSKILYNEFESTKKLAAHMTDLALRDGLTNLINYRGLEDIWASWDKEHSWIFMIDLDDFKKVNDTYGHIAGNQVLKKVGEILTDSLRTNDIVCRMGGDEFIILCGEIYEETEVHLIAQRIVDNIAAVKKEVPCWVGASVGVTRIHPEEALDQAIQRADQALYHIKKTTKNGYYLI